jgi:hypothetical protein
MKTPSRIKTFSRDASPSMKIAGLPRNSVIVNPPHSLKRVAPSLLPNVSSGFMNSLDDTGSEIDNLKKLH